MRRHKWTIIAAVIVALLLAHPLILSVFSLGSKAITVSQVIARSGTTGQTYSVEGQVADGTINWDAGTGTTSFGLTDGNHQLEVVYHGTVPDTFRPGSEMTIEGSFGGGGRFTASSLNSRRPVCTACHG